MEFEQSRDREPRRCARAPVWHTMAAPVAKTPPESHAEAGACVEGQPSAESMLSPRVAEYVRIARHSEIWGECDGGVEERLKDFNDAERWAQKPIVILCLSASFRQSSGLFNASPCVFKGGESAMCPTIIMSDIKWGRGEEGKCKGV